MGFLSSFMRAHTGAHHSALRVAAAREVAAASSFGVTSRHGLQALQAAMLAWNQKF